MAEGSDLRCDLVLAGGSVKGIAILGVLSALHDAGYRVHRAAGSSAGAILASLAVAGMTPDEVRERVLRAELRTLLDLYPSARVPARLGYPWTLVRHGGLARGDRLTSLISDLLAERGVHRFDDPPVRLAEGDEPGRGAGAHSRLIIMCSDVTAGRQRRFPADFTAYEPTLDLTVAEAVRASMSLPMLFSPVIVRSRGREHWLVDGGLLSDFPVNAFDRADGPPRWPTFGVSMARYRRVNEIKGPMSLGRAMAQSLRDFHDRLYVEDPLKAERTIFVDTGDVSLGDFDLDRESVDLLHRRGRDAAQRFLDAWDMDAHRRRREAIEEAWASVGGRDEGAGQFVSAPVFGSPRSE